MDYYLKRKILNLFFPNRCPLCDEIISENDCFCPDCAEKVKLYNGNFSVRGASECYSAIEYGNEIMPAVRLLKKGTCGNSAYAFGVYLAEVLKKNGIPEKIDFIVPVPVSAKSRRKRGYNQSELIARAVGAETARPVKCPVRKVRETKEQKSLGRAGRMINLKGAFILTENISGSNILLIDDICTTGSTLSEISLLLRKNGAQNVICATAMKVVKKKTGT